MGHRSERMNTLTERKAVLEAKLAKAPNADPIRIHPKMALTYRDKVTELINRLSDKDTMPEAKTSSTCTSTATSQGYFC